MVKPLRKKGPTLRQIATMSEITFLEWDVTSCVKQTPAAKAKKDKNEFLLSENKWRKK